MGVPTGSRSERPAVRMGCLLARDDESLCTAPYDPGFWAGRDRGPVKQSAKACHNRFARSAVDHGGRVPLTVPMSQWRDDEPERLILKAGAIHRWRGRKRGQTLLRTYVGQLLLTDRRLVHLSSGGNGVAKGVVMVLLGALPGVAGPAVSIGEAATKGVGWAVGKLRDREADDTVTITADQLAVEGSLSMPLESIEDVGLLVKRLTVALWVAARGADGEVREYTFADQASMPRADLWEPAIRRARADLLAR